MEATKARTEEELQIEQLLDEEILLGWEITESSHREHGIMWYFWMILGALALMIYAIFTQAWTLAVAIAVLAGVIFLFSQEPPLKQSIVITRMGIHVNKKFYPYNSIKSFWIQSEPGYKALYFLTGVKLLHVVHLNMGDMNPVSVRDVLIEQKVPEGNGKTEKFVDVLARKFKL